MKKILILIITLLLSSCWTNDNTDMKETIHWDWVTNTAQEIEIIENVKIENITEISNNKELIKHKDWNIYLYENWTQIDYLTTKAKTCPEFSDGCEENTYTIINSKWDYAVVEKISQHWECSSIYYYWYNLNGNSDVLTELYENKNCFLSLNSNLNWNKLEITPTYPEMIIENEDQYSKWSILVSYLQEEWFVQNWSNWIKSINLSETLEEIKDIPNTLTGIYSHDTLIKNGYKLNNLWSIKEYYKEVWTPPSEEFGRWFTTWKTIYIEWNKVLDFEINNWWGSNLIVNNPKIVSQINLSEYNYPIQAIFSSWEWAKIIINDLDTIKIVNKSKWINKTIWKR